MTSGMNMDMYYEMRNVRREHHARRRAERGAALLDSKYPGWESHIKIEMLDLSSPCNCILGQLVVDGTIRELVPTNLGLNPYQKGLNALGWRDDGTTPEHLGVELDELNGFEEGQGGLSYYELDEAWLDVLANRGVE